MRTLLFLLLVSCAIDSAGQNIPHPNIQAPMGLEINSFTGNLFYQRTDLTLRGVGLPVYGSFYYNTANAGENRGYGYGWNFYYDIYYKDSANTITIVRSDARGDLFTLTNGVYKAPKGVFDALTKNGSEYVLTTKEGLKYFFSNPVSKKLTRMSDATGNEIGLEYSSSKLAKVRNSSGRTMVLNWSGGALQSIQDSALPAKKYTYAYDANGDLVSVTNPLNKASNLAYVNHLLSRMTDEKNNPAVITYRSNNTVASINSCGTEIAFLLSEIFHYHEIVSSSFVAIVTGPLPRINTVTQTSSAGKETSIYQFDGEGHLLVLTNPDRQQASFAYDAADNLIGYRDFKGLNSTFSYDAKGNLLTQTDPQGNTLTYTYEPVFNKPLTVKDKKGQTTKLFYNGDGTLKRVEEPDGKTEQYEYHPNGNLKKFTSANGKITTYDYNGNGDLVKINYPVGNQQFEYSGSCCNLSKITDGNGNSLSLTYDLLNQVTSMKDDLANTVSKVYDDAGNLKTETDANGIAKNYFYDQSNRLSGVSLPSAGRWDYTYDGKANLTSIKDANGHRTGYRYNSQGNVVAEIDPLGNTTSYTYDANGNVLSKTFPNGNRIQYQYDALNRLVQKDYPGNSDKYSYDAAGNLVSAFNNNITYTFEYDNLNRLTKKNIVNWGKSISYTYDAAGNRQTMTDNDGLLYTYAYDDNNRLTSLKNGQNLTTSFEYDNGGRLTKQVNANNTFTTYHYDAAGRLDSIANKRTNGPDISFFSYTFDKQGNRISMRDKHGLHQYTYDSSYRLTAVQYADGSTESFKIDPTGNRTERTKNNVVEAYTYNAADQLQMAGATSFAYDAAGNTTQQTDSVQKKFEYDGENRLVKATINAVKTVQWLYDPFGEKIQRVDTNGVVTKFVYDGENLLAELDNSNNTLAKYTAGLSADSWLVMSRNNSQFFYQKDGLNSITEITDNGTTILAEYSYDVYGNITLRNEGLKNSLLYTGRTIEAIGIYDYRKRFYDPMHGSFLSPDTYPFALDLPLSINRYVYVIGNPTNFVDNTGEFAILPIIGVIAVNAIRGAVVGAAINGGLEAARQGYEMWQGKREDFCLDAIYSEAIYGAEVGAVAGPLTPYVFSGLGLSGIADYGFKNYLQTILGRSTNDAGISVGGSWLSTYLSSTAIFGTRAAIKKGTKSSVKSLIENDKSNCNEPPPDPGNQEIYGPPPPPPDFDIEVINYFDPNDILGTDGYGDKKWVSSKSVLPYKIRFSNDAEKASAPAQRVAIYMPIDNKLNPNSLRLGEFGFGPFTFSPPDNVATYSKRLDVRDSLGVFVDITAGMDIPGRRAFWLFESIDPATGLSSTLPVTKGFLPVNDTATHVGEGFVTLTIQPADNVRTTDTTSVYASIVFGNQDTVNTNRWVNTIDAGPPVSAVALMPPASSAYFPVVWSGRDDTLGSGIKYYDIYYSKNNGPSVLLRDKIDSNRLNFPGGDDGATYAFYSIATDNTGNREAAKNGKEASTTVFTQSFCPGGNVMFSNASLGSDYTYQWQVDAGSGYVNIANNAVYNGTSTTTLVLQTPPTSWYGYRYRCVATANGNPVEGPEQVLKFSNTWTGAVSSAWENPANWSCGVLPDEYTDVNVFAEVPNQPRVNSNAVCRSIKLSNGVLFNVSAGYNLEIKGK